MIRGPTTFRDPNGERRYKIASESVPLVLVLGFFTFALPWEVGPLGVVLTVSCP